MPGKQAIPWISGILAEAYSMVCWYGKTFNSIDKNRGDFCLDSIMSGSIYNAEKYLLKEPFLKYHDPSKPYTLFMDVSKYAWACVLTQRYGHEVDGKIITVHHTFFYENSYL